MKIGAYDVVLHVVPHVYNLFGSCAQGIKGHQENLGGRLGNLDLVGKCKGIEIMQQVLLVQISPEGCSRGHSGVGYQTYE